MSRDVVFYESIFPFQKQVPTTNSIPMTNPQNESIPNVSTEPMNFKLIWMILYHLRVTTQMI